VSKAFPITRDMLPGSTYAGNPLAAAAVVASLTRIRALDLPARVSAIERCVVEELGALDEIGVALRGQGALWVLELPSAWDTEAIVVELYRRGVAVGFAGRHIRILPAATIDPSRLATACATVRDEVYRYSHERNDRA